ncbi:hypothetical protein F7D57_13690 [Prevotella copri]|uniref:FIVAR domain-containing protein n=1 Tax=Segatella copri TaxID=165179 RepID=A0AA90VJB5_9BACT|nr:hypothetical protein [Segatella copri]MQO10742.1 hypothetical protein [Segatella copri]
MKRQLTSILLFSALLVGGASTFVSCTDHESDSAYNTSISLADAIAKEKQALIEITNTLETKADHAADKTALEGRINENKRLIDELGEKFGDYASLDAAIAASKAYTDEKVSAASDILNQKIEQLRGADETARQQLKTALLEKITANGEAISNEADARQQLQDNYDMAFDFLINKNLNSIAINATENPVLGYYNAAFIGSQLNLVSSFYGTAAQNKTGWVSQGEFLNNGNAGEIYVSLNPTEIDPRCITSLKLVDSQGNEAKGFELGQLQNTSRVLTYGFTKAADVSSNGFYAIPVKAVDPANDDFSLNKGELKEAAKNVLAKLKNPKESSLNLSQVATALYSSVNNQLKAYTVKAEYYLWNPETMELVKKSAVAPTYNVAAFAVKPLSYNTLKDNQSLKNLGLALDKYMLPTLSDKLGKFMDALDFQINNENGKQIKMYSMLSSKNIRCWEEGNDVIISNSNGETYTLKNTKIARDLSSWNLNTDVFQYVPEWGGYAYTNLAVGESERLFIFETTDNTIDELIGSINDQIGTQLQPVKDAITNAATKWDNAITPVNNLLHKINAHISDVNQLLQPTMLYKSTKTNSWNTLSTLKGKLGTRMTGTGSTVLVATSWTGELLAPAYKKKVYVKDNKGKNIDPNVANVTLMDGKTSAETPFSGSVQKVLFTTKAKGNYTIVYEAVDYSGVSAKKEYHITVE